MSDSTRITEVDITPKGAAYHAARQVLGAGPVALTAELVAQVVEAAVEAYERERPSAQVRLLRPQAGDVVVFHFNELMTQQEISDFAEQMRPATRHIENVKFIAVDRCPDITVVRDERAGLEHLRAVAEKLEAEQLMREAKSDG